MLVLPRGSIRIAPIPFTPLTTAAVAPTFALPLRYRPSLRHRAPAPRRGPIFPITPKEPPAPAEPAKVEQSHEDEEEEELQVKPLEDLPEQWRRAKIAWLCKELPSYTHSSLTRILNAQRKWITQDDATYVVAHFLRVRENDAAYRVYIWMVRQHWFAFRLALATKLADCLGKDRRVAKCREVFDDTIARGRVPRDSTFHILVVAYLSAPNDGGLEEACDIYNRMIRLGGYRPQLSLHNSLFRAIVSRPGASARYLLPQAEFIFRNIETSGLEIQKDIYSGLIWLHSYQDSVDRARIEELRAAMRSAGFEESRDVLVSVLRACSKDGDVEEGEKSWDRIIAAGSGVPSQAFVYKMELYSKIGQPLRALNLFHSTKARRVSPNLAAYQKIIEVISRAKEVEIAESLLEELAESGLKPLSPSYLAVMDMYLTLDMLDRLEQAFSQCVSRCGPNRNVYTLYLYSLVRRNEIARAEEIFGEMHANAAIGTSAQSCNAILGGFLTAGEHEKAEKIRAMMVEKKYEIEPEYLTKMEEIIKQKKRMASKRPVTLKLNIEQREILIGLILGGLSLESDDEQRRSRSIQFEFRQSSSVHCLLRAHIHERFHEWLTEDGEQWAFSTISHLCFGFFADQFWDKRRLVIPRLIHRWVSERVLAYWYMYGGFRSSSGDVLLKLKVARSEDVERVVKCFIARSLNCRTKRKGRVFWIGLQGDDATRFWEMVEPYVLETAREALDPGSLGTGGESALGDSDSESGCHDDADEVSV